MIDKVFLDITNKCNSNCVYCFTNSKNTNEDVIGELSYEDIETLIDDLVKLGVKEISLGGGEPFLRDVCRIIEYVRRRMSISITTNGSIMDRQIIECLEKNNVKITVSLDAMEQDISNVVRKGIDINLVIANIHNIIDNPVVRNNLSIRTTVSKYNINGLLNIIDFCNENRINRLKINSVNSFGRAKKLNIAPDFHTFMETLDLILQYCKTNNICTKVSLPVEKYLQNHSRNCTLGNLSIYIDSFGNVFPCAFSEGRLSWGNVKNKNISIIIPDCWNYDNKICLDCEINRYKSYRAKTQ